MRSHAKVLVALAALCSFFALSAPAALAAYGQVGTFANGGPGQGGSGTDNGYLNDPGQADVNSTSGDFYVADTANNRVQRFQATATAAEYHSQVAVTSPSGLAVDQASGAVYVSHSTGIAKYDASLSPAAGWTDPAITGTLALGVDPSSGDLLVADAGANLIRRFNSDGSADGTFAAQRPVDVAATSSGQIIAITTTGDVVGTCSAEGTVQRFAAAGSPEGTIGAGLPTPAQLAVDPDDDSLVVAARNNQYNCGGSPPYLAFFAADGTAGETIDLPTGFPVNTIYGQVAGLAAQGGGSTRVYAVDKAPFDDGFGATAALVYAQLSPPEVTVDVGVVGGFEAELKGTVDPNGKSTDYHFEYRAKGAAAWQSTPTESAGSGDDPVPASATVDGLVPAAEYEAKLVAQNADGNDSAGPVQFETVAVAPVAETLPPGEVGDTSVRLRASVNPGGAPTAYHFEYGTSAGYGNVVPLHPASIGSGVDPVTVSALIDGLDPGSTYHYRVVASNSVGPSEGLDRAFETEPAQGSCANERIRIAQGATHLPDCRAWEMVSPQAKGGIDISGISRISLGEASEDGNALAYSSNAAFGDAAGAAFPNVYLARRTASAWSSKAVSPPQEETTRGGLGGGHTSMVYGFTPDMSKAIVRTNTQLDPAATVMTDSVYVRDMDSGTHRLMTPGIPADVDKGVNTIFYRDVTPDLRHVGVQTVKVMTADAVPDGAYVFSDGAVELVSYLPGPGLGVPSDGIIGGTASEGLDFGFARNAISDDGRWVYWQRSAASNVYTMLYLRDRATDTTLEVSSEPARFLAGLPDGSAALYLQGGGDELCRFERSAGVSHCTEVADDTKVASVLAISDDLSSVYLRAVSAGVNRIVRIQPDESSPLGSVEPVAVLTDTVTESAPEVLEGAFNFETFRRVAATPSGDRFVFSTIATVDGIDDGGHNQVYVYDAQSGSVTCVSCPLRGRPTGYAGLTFNSLPVLQMALFQPVFSQARAVTGDGASVFFETNQRLIPADVNGVTDVYAWTNGDLRLLSTGTSRFEARMVDASASGGDVFIATRARLSAHDTDSLVDIYDVRAGGGYPEPVERVACLGEACLNPPRAPSVPTPASAAFHGPGNTPAKAGKRRCGKGKRAVKRGGKTRCVKKKGKRKRNAKKRHSRQTTTHRHG